MDGEEELEYEFTQAQRDFLDSTDNLHDAGDEPPEPEPGQTNSDVLAAEYGPGWPLELLAFLHKLGFDALGKWLKKQTGLTDAEAHDIGKFAKASLDAIAPHSGQSVHVQYLTALTGLIIAKLGLSEVWVILRYSRRKKGITLEGSTESNTKTESGEGSSTSGNQAAENPASCYENSNPLREL